MKKAAEAQQWMQELLAGTAAQERGALGQLSPQARAARTIQRRVRGTLGRKAARRAFASTFTKKYDPASQLYFYLNTSYGTTAWARPAITARLFPTSTW